MEIVIAGDLTLPRKGVAGLVEKRGHEMAAVVNTAHGLVAGIDDRSDNTSELPDLVITGMRMPLKMSDDDLRAAVKLYEHYPWLNVMVLSQYVAPAYARKLFSLDGAGGNAGVGTGVGSGGSGSSGGARYLLEDRVGQVLDFLGSLRIVASGNVVIDPGVATALMQSGKSGLASLTACERKVLELMTHGKLNKQIAGDLVLPGAAMMKHIFDTFMKPHLEPGEGNRRVQAVLEFLMATSGQI